SCRNSPALFIHSFRHGTRMRSISFFTGTFGSSLRVFSLACAASLALFLGSVAQAASPNSTQGKSMSTHPRVNLQTNQGEILIELDAEKAPKTVESFLTYVNEGFYDGTIFHRVINNF